MLKVLPDLKPIEKLVFLVISSYQDNKTLKFARALDYIDPSSIIIIEQDQKFDIRVYNRAQSEAATVVQLLEANGYVCSLVKTNVTTN